MINRHYQQGIGLLELMLSLAIIALIMIMATRYYSVVQQQQKITQALQISAATLQAAHTWGAGQSEFPTKPDELQMALVKAGLLPESYLTNPWGGQLELKGRETNGPYLGFTFRRIPSAQRKEICGVLERQLLTNPPGSKAPRKFGDVITVECEN
ncbi:MAG: type II secretion system protein [Gammaproteobacteria bacterium]